MQFHRKKECNRQRYGEANYLVNCECGCEEMLYRYDKWSRPRKYISGHNNNGLVVCPVCGKMNNDRWPTTVNGKVKEKLCQDCWEAACAESWWDAVEALAN